MIIIFFIFKLFETIIQNIFQTLNLFITSIQINSETFYNYIGGFGLLLAGIGAVFGITNWTAGIREKKITKNIRMKDSIEELKARYPIEKFRKTFNLIRSSANPRPVYLFDKNTNKKYWIRSASTFLALGYNFTMVDTIDPEEFNKSDTGYEINIE